MIIDLRVPRMVKFASGSIGNQWASPEPNMMEREKAGLRQLIPIAPKLPAESFAGGTAPKSFLFSFKWRKNASFPFVLPTTGLNWGVAGIVLLGNPTTKVGGRIAGVGP